MNPGKFRLDKEGPPHFDGLRSRRADTAVVFYAFDLLYLDGFDLTRVPLGKRKTLLKRILPKKTSVGRSGGGGEKYKKAGAELIREANKLPKNNALRDALKIEGQRLINQGKSISHK